ncbi:DUF305 domain-containing protein [Ornithinimicrobium murale]|uniref:DUF305 domain-containing protein n=1 Tax=Ornithinimicrobium murale TaxID=1050153 RepID=UPI000E0CDB59|nr:DUF305 domain-containing protein [Ornithinimicrobium murale]
MVADTDATEQTAPRGSRFGRVGVGVLAAVAVIGLILGTQLGWLVFGNTTPGDESVAAGFARDMGEHHAQAVEMSLEVLQTTEADDVRALATDIASTQGNQQGQMEGWIRTWGLPMARPGDRMDWMDQSGMTHSMHQVEGAPMAGMANPEQMESLRAAEGEAADVLYLQLMITHHIAGVEMAQAAVDGGVEGEVERLAAAMVNGQESEIDLMLGMLEERGEQSQEQSGLTVGVAEQSEPMEHEDMGHGDGADETDGGHADH